MKHKCMKFTDEMVEQATKANESVKGTSVYGAYYVPLESKNKAGKWTFISWTHNYRVGVIRKFRDKLYVYYLDGFGNEYRYELTYALRKMFNLEVA